MSLTDVDGHMKERFDTMGNRSQKWRETVAHRFTEKILADFEKRDFGRASLLIKVGRTMDIVPKDFVREHVKSKLDSFDLREQIPRRILAANLLISHHEAPALSHLEQLVNELYSADAALAGELDNICNQRCLEVIDQSMTSAQPLTAWGEEVPEHLIQEQLVMHALGNPDQPRAIQILLDELDRDLSDILDPESPIGATHLDRTIEKLIALRVQHDAIDMDTFAIHQDQIEQAVLDYYEENGITHTNFELLLGLISPFCRAAGSKTKHMISKEFQERMITVLDDFLRSFPGKLSEDKEFYTRCRVLFAADPNKLFSYYWDELGIPEYDS